MEATTESFNWSLFLANMIALAAIIAPLISSWMNAKSAERIKKDELLTPRVYDALAEMVETYTQLTRWDNFDTRNQESSIRFANARFKSFMTASYKAMAVIPNQMAQSKIAGFSQAVGNKGGIADEHSDKAFDSLMIEITACVAGTKVKKGKGCKKE